MATLLSEVLARVRDNLDEQTQGSWLQQSLRRWINEGMQDAARETKALKGTTTINVATGVSEYTLAANILEVYRLYFVDAAGNRNPLAPTQYEGADQIWGANQNTRSGDPVMFTTWGFPPSLVMKVYPTPTANVVGGFILHIARMPALLDITGAGDGTAVDFPESWIDVIVDYCEYRALRKDRDPRWQESYNFYREKRDALQDTDYLDVSRNVIIDAVAGSVPSWIADPGWG